MPCRGPQSAAFSFGTLICMITPSHIVYNWALGRFLDKRLGYAQHRMMGLILGSFLPDIPAYTFFFYHTFIVGSAQGDMWDTLYFEGAFAPYITLSHSFLLWPFLVAVGYAF